MKKYNDKILLCGIPEKTGKDLIHNLIGTSCISQICSLEDLDNTINEFKPDIILTGILPSMHEYVHVISKVKAASNKNNIPLAVIIKMNEEDPYCFLLNENIKNIITIPAMKNDFIKSIDKFIRGETLTGNRNREFSCSENESSLITNLINQNKLARKSLLKTDDDKFEKFHLPRITGQREMENKLWNAYENGYFRLFYQPVIHLASGKLSGFESLIRLDHPDEGLISPADFIPAAENSAIIFPLGLWIIEEACNQITRWKEKFIFDTPFKININLSAKQFMHPDLTSHILEITEKTGTGENDIAFELTESAFMEDMERANIALLELRSKHFTLYMDDFGTGYSSLSYLMHFPVNVIKIDQSFVKWMHIDEQSEMIVKSLINLAHNLGLNVVAEGTEEMSQIEILKECNCDYAQGYYYSRPLPADDAEKYIAGHFNLK